MSKVEDILNAAYAENARERKSFLAKRAEVDAELSRLDADKAEIEDAFQKARGKPIPEAVSR